MGQTTTQSYKRCSRCKEEILMSNASGKWKALDEWILQHAYAVVIIVSATTTSTAA